MSKTKNDFIQGIVYSAARVIEQADEPTIAMDVLRSASIDREVAVAAGTDGYDIEFIDQVKAWPKP